MSGRRHQNPRRQPERYPEDGVVVEIRGNVSEYVVVREPVVQVVLGGDVEPLLERKDALTVVQRQVQTDGGQILQPVVDPAQKGDNGQFKEQRAPLGLLASGRRPR